MNSSETKPKSEQKGWKHLWQKFFGRSEGEEKKKSGMKNIPAKSSESQETTDAVEKQLSEKILKKLAKKKYYPNVTREFTVPNSHPESESENELESPQLFDENVFVTDTQNTNDRYPRIVRELSEAEELRSGIENTKNSDASARDLFKQNFSEEELSQIIFDEKSTMKKRRNYFPGHQEFIVVNIPPEDKDTGESDAENEREPTEPSEENEVASGSENTNKVDVKIVSEPSNANDLASKSSDKKGTNADIRKSSDKNELADNSSDINRTDNSDTENIGKLSDEKKLAISDSSDIEDSITKDTSREPPKFPNIDEIEASLNALTPEQMSAIIKELILTNTSNPIPEVIKERLKNPQGEYSREQAISTTNEREISSSKEELVSTTNEKTISATNEEVISKANERGIPTANERGISTANERGISTANEQAIATTNEREISSSEEELISTTNEEAISATNEVISEANERGISKANERGISTSNERRIATMNEQLVAATSDDESSTPKTSSSSSNWIEPGETLSSIYRRMYNMGLPIYSRHFVANIRRYQKPPFWPHTGERPYVNPTGGVIRDPSKCDKKKLSSTQKPPNPGTSPAPDV